MVTDMINKGELSIPKPSPPTLGRLGRADEIAAAVVWLSSPAASLIIGKPYRGCTARSLMHAQPSQAIGASLSTQDTAYAWRLPRQTGG